MVLSIHDNLLLSYEVRCEARTITLRTEPSLRDGPAKFTNVIFTGVQGYHFENDAFRNIIFDVETISVEEFLTDYANELSESYRAAGSPGPWAANLETAPVYLRELGIQGFILCSSYGLSGWVLAQEMSICAADKGPTD